jgi:DNA-binding SARP family transcriptional activator
MLDDQPELHFETNKVRALLAYLAVESNRPHSREFLADLLWPGSTHASALGNLRYTVSSLKKTLQKHQPVAREATGATGGLIISRETLEFDSSGSAWVDASELSRLLPANRPAAIPIERLERAANLYRGSFLEGFSLPDSAAFDEWLLLKREQFNRLMLKTLYQLSDYYEGQGDYERAQHYAWRQVELEPWLEEGYQQLMRVLALGGQRSVAIAQYEVCRKLLSRELGILPSQETVKIYHLVMDGNLDELRSRHPLPTHSSQPNLAVYPALGSSAIRLDADRSSFEGVFVDRLPELDHLQACLEQAISGHGQIVFITGEPGSGKTALAEEFTRRALASNPSLVATAGACSAQSDVSDPFLPFVEILQTLTGDYEGYCHPQALSRLMIERLQTQLPSSIHLVAEQGSELVAHLLTRETLIQRSRELAGPTAGHTEQLLSQIHPEHLHLGTIQPAIYEQLTHVLLSLARSHPLLLILDDLQWADRSTIGMLHHLGRRLSVSRVLILCLYRPGDLYAETGKALHPLEQTIDELLVECGDLTIDLSLSDNRQFIDAYLDRYPNRFSPEFRQQLFVYTNGNPLLAVELINALQANGEISLNDEGYLICAEHLAWDVFPPRSKAMIEVRFHHLRPVWLRLLQTASINAPDFIAEVAARLAGVSSQAAIDWLSGPLSRNFRLVEGLGVQYINDQQLSYYRFKTPLYQIYLYHQLDEVERISLHARAAAHLQTLHRKITDN